MIKAKIQSGLGENYEVAHRGSTSLGISGQDEIDVYVPVAPANFDATIPLLAKLFGEPRASYPMERVRFMAEVEGKKIDLFLINREHADWIDGVKFEAYLHAHPETLRVYKELKESLDGQSIREFYRQKIEFINKVLELGK